MKPESAVTVETKPADQRQTWYFTFGQAHRFANRFFVVENATYDEARQRMFAKFGREWAFQYDAGQWFRRGVSQAEYWGLKEVR